jgi:succinyl-CoA synthetase alpha subunit
MIVRAVVRKNSYYDSVTLMAISKDIVALDGVEDAVVSMGTDNNKALLANAGMMSPDAENAGPNDLVIAFKVVDETAAETVSRAVEDALRAKGGEGKTASEVPPASIASAVKRVPEANLAIVSLPGQYAAREAMRALKQGLHVMLFSDNVSVDEEVKLKEFAHEAGLLMMGPDCGTAIINGSGLCFANSVRAGSVGVIGASGTGTQEVTVLVDRFGAGVSQAIGTGGRDLSEAVGGRMMLDALDALDADEQTGVIVLVSKPPVKSVAEKVLTEARRCRKPVVVCFIHGGSAGVDGNLYFEPTLERAAARAASLAGGLPDAPESAPSPAEDQHLRRFAAARKENQQYVRGLFCGGTLCDEARYIFKDELPGQARVWSNIAKDPAEKLLDPTRSSGHTFIDLGDDTFTIGKPHPMIDPTLRTARILQEAKDPCTAVILLDVVLGYGSHADPAGVTAQGVREAKALAAAEGREICFIAYVCGTETDFQNRAAQEAKLAAEGVVLAQSNARAARLAAAVIGG